MSNLEAFGGIYVIKASNKLETIHFEEIKKLWRADFFNELSAALLDALTEEISPLETKVVSQIREYLEGERKKFTIDFELPGTDFQKRVYEETLNIPYGEIRTYKEIAERLGSSSRAVGSALSKNPFEILIPCHRVVGQNSLVGYKAGLKIKEELLVLEQRNK